MTEPTTPNAALIVPNTGDLVGSWGTAALNANFTVIDGKFGGTLNISLSGATTVTLTGPAGSITPGAGPTQQQNQFLNFSGAQTGNALFFMSLPGVYVVNNKCTGTTAFLQFAPATGTGIYIGVPQGKQTLISFDGIDVNFVNPQDPGTAYDLHGVNAVPLWMQACKVRPYLQKDGTVYNVSDYAALAKILGSTFGGNGITTFAVPDELSRVRLPWDFTGSALRITGAGAGFNGAQMGAAGGNQFLQSHTHANTVSEVPHSHSISNNYLVNGGIGQLSGGAGVPWGTAAQTQNATASVSITNAVAGGGTSQNVQPTIVSFLAFIKT